MPYSTISDLPDAVTNALPTAAQRQFLRVVNSQLERGLGEDAAFASAWAAVKRQYKKTNEGWVEKSALGEETDEEDTGGLYTDLLKAQAPQRYTLGIVYEPMTEDLQGDFAKADSIRQAAWNFMRRLQQGPFVTKGLLTLLQALRKMADDPEQTTIRLDVTDLYDDILKGMLGDQHSDWDDRHGDIVECYCAPCDLQIGATHVTEGTWLMGVVWSPEYFQKIQAGERTGYSMGGKGRREWVEEMSSAA